MRRFFPLVCAVLLVLAAVSCKSTGPAPEAPQTEKQYAGAGEDPSLLAAMNKAKLDAVKKAVIEMIGAAAERANAQALNAAIYGTANPNVFVVSDSFQTTRKDKRGEDYVVEATVLVRLDVVRQTLEARGLLGGGLTPADMTAEPGVKVEPGAALGDAGSGGGGGGAAGADAGGAATAEEQKVIKDYVEHMTYMVYVPEKTTLDPFFFQVGHRDRQRVPGLLLHGNYRH